MDTIIKKSKSQLESLIEGTYKLLSEETLNKAIEKISTADRIYLAGVAASGLICDDFSYKLKRVSNKVAYERDSHTNLASISHITCKDSLLCVSYSGETREVIEAARWAIEKGAFVISISKSSTSNLGKLSNLVFEVPSFEKELRYGAISSRYSSLIITDILYYGYVLKNMDEVMEFLAMSKDLTDNIK